MVCATTVESVLQQSPLSHQQAGKSLLWKKTDTPKKCDWTWSADNKPILITKHLATIILLQQMKYINEQTPTQMLLSCTYQS